LGSGVTFFPFSVAKLGYQVTCVDIDPIVDVDIARAARIVDQSPGEVDCRQCDSSHLPFADEEADVVYCISVLEHVSDFENTIDEVFRVLKIGGLFILTMDLDSSGYLDIGVNQ
jgi:ubiquinone/menaquinone biosynthesis C-methylase UbiE